MAHETIAQAVLREIPLTRLSRFLDEFGDPNPVANGAGCGNGCGAGCLDGFGLTFDRYGHSRIPADELINAQRDVSGLKDAIRSEVNNLIS